VIKVLAASLGLVEVNDSKQCQRATQQIKVAGCEVNSAKFQNGSNVTKLF
jgi:hypothetical protein